MKGGTSRASGSCSIGLSPSSASYLFYFFRLGFFFKVIRHGHGVLVHHILPYFLGSRTGFGGPFVYLFFVVTASLIR